MPSFLPECSLGLVFTPIGGPLPMCFCPGNGVRGKLAAPGRSDSLAGGHSQTDSLTLAHDFTLAHDLQQNCMLLECDELNVTRTYHEKSALLPKGCCFFTTLDCETYPLRTASVAFLFQRSYWSARRSVVILLVKSFIFLFNFPAHFLSLRPPFSVFVGF